jgi:hypothetical protein
VRALISCLGGPALKRLFLLYLLVSSAYGCLIFPLPSDHGSEIDEAQSKIIVGSTTREEVISILGDPDVSKDRFILFSRKEYGGGVGWACCLGSPMGGSSGVEGQVFMGLYFEFDNYGVLMDYHVKKYGKGLDYIK